MKERTSENRTNQVQGVLHNASLYLAYLYHFSALGVVAFFEGLCTQYREVPAAGKLLFLFDRSGKQP